MFTVIALGVVPSRSHAVTGEYVWESSNSIMHLSLNAQGKSVSGYLTTCTRDFDAAQATRVSRQSAKGSITGSSLVLNISYSVAMNGQATSDRIVMKWPLSNGSIQEVIFKRTSTKTWNIKLDAFRASNVWAWYKHSFGKAIGHRLEILSSQLDKSRHDEEKTRKLLTDVQRKELSTKADLIVLEADAPTIVKKIEELRKELAVAEAKFKQTNKSEDEDQVSRLKSKLSDADDELEEIRDDQRELQNELREITSEAAKCKTSLLQFPKLNEQLNAEVRLISTDSVFKYFGAGKALPVLSVRLKNPTAIFASPRAGSGMVSAFEAGDTMYYLPTKGPWRMVLLRNNMIGWVIVPPLAVKKRK